MSKTKIKTILMAIAILLVFALLGGFIAQLVLRNKDDVSDNGDGSIIVSDGGETVTEIEGSGVTLTSKKIARSAYAASGISETADNAYTLTASITPENATDKTVDWAVAFVNPSSTWASGKTITDYATITPASDGALTATLVCLQAFGEQIKVTVTSRSNVSATASCTLDYVKRINDIDLYFLGGDANADNCVNDTSEVTLTSLDNTFVTGFKIDFYFGVGTVCDEMSDICLSFPGGTGYDVYWTKESDTEYSYTETITWFDLCDSIGYSTKDALYEKLKTAYDNNEAYSFTLEGKGATIGSWSFTGFGLLINPEGLYTYATGVTLSNTSIKF